MAAAFQPPTFVHPAAHGPVPVAGPVVPAGTFVPGTKVQVGGHRVIIEKYLSEGGFAHVYLVRLPKPIDGDDTAVLKRVAVPDKEALASMRTEVETMKKLKGHRHIVTYIDSHASQLKGGGYEVFLLMEYCNGGGLIDFMNTRLQNRLTEPEVLKIFSDVAQGVACMHYLKPPLLHRDLKVENVLIRTSGSTRRYKLCDFGSTAPPRPAATSAVEGRLIEDDVQKNTTLQYRSPEMIDVYRKQPIDEKSDIWALGVLLYKLCYYKTPFEEQGQMAILNASFKFPGYPAFSDRIKKLIASLLRENPQQRPNVYQVIKEVCLMRGTDVPIKDIYAGRSHSEARRNQHLPPSEPDVKTPPMVAGAFKAPPVVEKQSIPDITPMRRGRPTTLEAKPNTAKPSPSPLRNSTSDPFSVLDSAKAPARNSANLDDISTRFPALDDFSLLHDSGSKFAFDSKPAPVKAGPPDITQRVTNALADDAFALPAAAAKATTGQPHSTQTSADSRTSISTGHAPSSIDKNPVHMHPASQNPLGYVSTGTMTSNPPSPTENTRATSTRPIFRFAPSSMDEKPSGHPRTSDAAELMTSDRRDDATSSHPAQYNSRPKSQGRAPEQSLSSRPSLEANNKSSLLGGFDNTLHRSRSATVKSRPSSGQSLSKPSIFRRLSREKSREPRSEEATQENEMLTSAVTGSPDDGEEATKIGSNVDYLKVMEEEEAAKKREKRLSGSSKHFKRTSMPSVSLSGTKSLLAGRFGEAFRRYETNSDEPTRGDDDGSPGQGGMEMPLSPIVGSEATDGRSDDGNSLEESEEAPPEVRRELERRRLEQEEKRVTDAAMAYRQRLAEGGKSRVPPGPNKKAMSIQSKVMSLLDESGRASPSPTKTAAGYGRYTDRVASPSPISQPTPSVHPPRTSSRQVTMGPQSNGAAQTSISRPPSNAPVSLASRINNNTYPNPPSISQVPLDISRHSAPPSENPTSRPAGPPKPQPKPQALRTGDRGPPSPLKPSTMTGRKSLSTRNPYQTSPPQQFGQKTPTPGNPQVDGPATDDDWESTFSKRYPDLSGLGLVETDIDDKLFGGTNKTGNGPAPGREMKIKDI